MPNIDLNNFNLVKFGNVDAERNYTNDILHAITAKLAELQQIIDSIPTTTASITGSVTTVESEFDLVNSRQLAPETSVMELQDGGPGAQLIIAIADSGIDTIKLKDASVTIPKIGATGTADNTTYLRGDAIWTVPPADLSYVFTQSTPSTSWTVTHNLNKYPSVTVVDSAGTVVIGQVVYNSINQCTLSFTAAFSGKAFFN